MKKHGIRMSIAFVLVVVLVIGSVSTAIAGPPDQSISIEIDEIQDGQIDFHYQWNRFNARNYLISLAWWDPEYAGSGAYRTIGSTGITSLGGRTTSMPATAMNFTDDDLFATAVRTIDDGERYLVMIRLLGKNTRKYIRGAYANDYEYCPYP